MIQSPLQEYLRDRKVLWVQDPRGGHGKSTFIKYLAMNEKFLGLGVEKLPIDRPDRVRSAVIKLSKKKDVDIYIFDFTRTQGVDTHFQDLFEVIEEIKNSYVVDIMYGNFNRAFLKAAIVIIFTNNDINQFKKYLSEDRWEPFLICDTDSSLAYIKLQDNDYRVPFKQYLTSTLKNYSNS